MNREGASLSCSQGMCCKEAISVLKKLLAICYVMCDRKRGDLGSRHHLSKDPTVEIEIYVK